MHRLISGWSQPCPNKLILKLNFFSGFHLNLGFLGSLSGADSMSHTVSPQILNSGIWKFSPKMIFPPVLIQDFGADFTNASIQDFELTFHMPAML